MASIVVLRIFTLTEISRLSAIAPELAGLFSNTDLLVGY
jgi:hypothetical protein